MKKGNGAPQRAVGFGLILVATGAALGSSHSDAPLIKQDPQANLTDVYGFIGLKYDDPSTKVLNVVVNVRPFSEPGDGVTYDRFADDARYSIHIADPATGETMVRYDFFFSAVNEGYKNLSTILSYGLGTEAGPLQNNGDARQNFTQTYVVRKVVGESTTQLGAGLLVAPPNVGKNTTPFYNDADGRAVSGAATFDALDRYTKEAVYDLPGGESVFCGSRDDSFFSDIPGIFDLLDARILDNNGNLADGLGQDGNGVDGFKGFNVLTFALQIPVAELPSREFNSVFFGPQTGVGIYASVGRPRVRMLLPDGRRSNRGPYVQVNRLGNPLFNEGLIALRDKDKFNRTSPPGDQQFATYARNPELAALLNFVFQTGFATAGREDLVNIFIPDVLRVNTTTDPVPLDGAPGFHRLGFLGGDTTNGVSSGFPNGRRLGDDVVDVALTAIASGPTYSVITVVGDNVAHNDVPYNQVFPYSATPHSGSNNRKDPE
ncbi:MAG: DUF4331 domain-containing protein [Planctomycetes bacterium]|nr:DUF4331 domain-containing protein [Planctomycetota bacterium]